MDRAYPALVGSGPEGLKGWGLDVGFYRSLGFWVLVWGFGFRVLMLGFIGVPLKGSGS